MRGRKLKPVPARIDDVNRTVGKLAHLNGMLDFKLGILADAIADEIASLRWWRRRPKAADIINRLNARLQEALKKAKEEADAGEVAS